MSVAIFLLRTVKAMRFMLTVGFLKQEAFPQGFADPLKIHKHDRLPSNSLKNRSLKFTGHRGGGGRGEKRKSGSPTDVCTPDPGTKVSCKTVALNLYSLHLQVLKNHEKSKHILLMELIMCIILSIFADIKTKIEKLKA